jgi:NodT family efflux transporter outer membrane factor (OMF) lipoprotein
MAAVLPWVLNGCAVAPPATDAAINDVPATWSAAAAQGNTGETSLASWWLRFNDPLLARLVADALRANTTVTGAQAALRQAQALRDAAAAALFPTLSAAAQTDAKSYQVGVEANWEVDVFGALRSARNASEFAARASDMDLRDVQVSVAADVALTYILLRSAQARQAIANSNLLSQQETLQITQWRQQAGLVTALEAEQARAAAAQTAALLPGLQTGIDQARHALAVLTGQPPAALDAVLTEIVAVPLPDSSLALRMPAETLRQRADVRAAELQIGIAQARVSQAEAARWPGFSLSGSVGLSGETLAALVNGNSLAGTVLASVTQPLFNGGALRAQVVAQQAALQQSQSAYRAAVLLALQDVEDALVALRGDGQRLARLIEAAEAATNAAQLANTRYTSGLADFQTVLETQRNQLGTQDGVASARADVSGDYVRLYRALGGGWLPDVPSAEAASP